MASKLLLAFLALTIGCSGAFAPITQQTRTRLPQNQHQQVSSLLLFSSPTPEENNDQSATTIEEENDEDDGGVLSKLNSVLDTPILDANNKEDQGPVINALKNFVRDDPDMASVTFSVVVVIFMAIATRGAMYVVNGY